MNAVTISARDLADRLNLTKHLHSWRGRCPSCDYEGNVFSVREGRGNRPRIYCANGCDREHLDDAINRVMGGTWTPPERGDDADAANARERKQAAALRLWNGSERGSGIVTGYLESRALGALARCNRLRLRGDCHHPEGGALPAMVALVTDAEDRPIAVHRTYLQRDGSGKANVEPAKATLGPMWGGAVRLSALAEELVIGEGIESSASAALLMQLPAWAALSAGNLAKGLVLPPEVRRVVIAADADKAGREAAQAAATRWKLEGRDVRIAMPDQPGADFNDVLKGQH